MSNSYCLEMSNIKKSFGNIKAIQNGNFNLKKGEIHSLIGENGAGKSTMMKIAYGLYAPDEGDILIKGEKYESLNPKKAIDIGIGMVHQEFMLVKELTVLENIILGFEKRKGIAIDFESSKKEINRYIDTYKMDIQINKRIDQISVGEAQRVEIIKTLYRGAEILIFDEPTAVLTPQETKEFFKILNILRESGESIVFISHKLNEVMEISDRITIMRQGQYIDTVNKTETNVKELAKMMVGRDIFLNVEKKKSNVYDVVLKVDDLWTSGEKELSKIRGISFDVKAGEIVGIAGIDGNGQSELIEAICGLRKVEKGDVYLDNVNITNKSPLKIRNSGLAHIPEDRNLRGLNRSLNIAENIIALKFNKKPYANNMIMNDKEIIDKTNELISKFDIRPAEALVAATHLSGGNAQKVVVAREVDANAKLLIASQPSRGVDIGAIESIRKILNEEKEKGKAILLVSADLEEILSLSDRIIVMYEGSITGMLSPEEANDENLSLLMVGENPHQ
ncbi:ABC transporter ATP-binding protein [Brachyspira murdochii]|uniref:ABC transporter related protein n=1 Tax=Brachyspira murdochii (strain ATCC 51284 / DSM 12563 / 56-150) TaxID=526224 RepID=D5U408_BRAM5|nr:ABC transporter ATP-binding protein [Brachyspira murdochii]ADG72189.1 ABC transporter related protein [Brachyspira murdochii DSM 12563]